MTRHLGEFEQLVLFAVVRLGDEAYGATVQEEIEARTGRSRSTGSIHTALDRLEQRGLVASRLGDPTPVRGGRRKRLFSVTAEGARQLQEAYEQVRSMARGTLDDLEQLARQES